MRYRPLSPSGDYTVGRPFLINSPEAVAQAVLTRLRLWRGEWFLDKTEGMPFRERVLGKQQEADAAIKQHILETQGVKAITSYDSTYDGDARKLTVSVELDTIYGATSVEATL